MMFFKEIKQEFKKITESRYSKIALIAVILVPLFYGALYLTAFWDPYDKLDQVQVAVVNEDKGYSDNTTKTNVGNDLVTSLKDNTTLNWQFVDQKTAENGLNQKKYYASITIPENFSENTYSVNGNNPIKANLIYKSREATNYLATTITKQVADRVTDSLSHQLIEKYFDNIFLNIKQTTDGLTKAKDASVLLAEGIGTANSGATSLKTGLNSVLDGNNKLADGLISINSNQTQLTNGLASAVSGTDSLITGATQVSGGMSQGKAALSAYIASNPSSASNPYIQGLSTAINSSIDGQSQLIEGLKTLNTKLVAAKDGSSKLASGSEQLVTGAKSINGGLIELSSGASDLESGLYNAKTGAKQLSAGLIEGVDQANAATGSESDQSKKISVMSSPVTLTNESYDLVKNYGSGFAPYFISLALWVGGLLAFFVINFDSKSQKGTTTLIKYIILAIVGVAQAVILDLVLQNILGLSVANPALYYGFTILISLTFMSLLQLLVQQLGDPGRYVAIILLILQLSSAAGTFPKETIPTFFQIINPFLPMTYSVMGIKDILYTNELSNLWGPVVYFVAILISGLALNIVFAKRRSAKTQTLNLRQKSL